VGFERSGGEGGDCFAPGGEEGRVSSCGLSAGDGERGGGGCQGCGAVFRGNVVVVVVFVVDGAAEPDGFWLAREVEGDALLDAVVELDAPPQDRCGGLEAGECSVESKIRVALAGTD